MMLDEFLKSASWFWFSKYCFRKFLRIINWRGLFEKIENAVEMDLCY